MKVVIEAYNTADVWRLSGSVRLRIYARQSFWTSDGQFIPQGTPGQANTAYLEITGSVVANVLTLPSFEIDSTVDSPDSPWTTYDAELVAGGRRIPFLSSFPVNTLADGDPSYTWVELTLFRNQFTPQTIPESLNRQVASMVTSAVGNLNKASETNLGVVALDTDPVDPAFPIAVGPNSPLLSQADSSAFVNALDNGVLNDAQVVEDAGVANGSPTLTSPSSAFTAGLVGQSVAVAGAGPAGATLVTTIADVPSPTTLTLATNASTTVANARTVYGTNNTTALQTLVDSMPAMADRSTVYLPKGNYLFATGSLTLPQGVTLQGTWEYPSDHMGYRFGDEPKPMDGHGSTLVITANEGTAAGRFIFLNSQSALRGVSMFWPAQVASLAAPKLYPWAVEMFGAGPTVENVELVNPYQGIYSHIGYRHRVANIKGTPLLTGLYTSQLLGVSHFANIVFEAIYTFANPESAPFPMTPLMQYVHQNCTAFKVGRVDAALYLNCFAFACLRGFKFVVDAPEVTSFANGTGAPGGKAWAQFLSCGADTCSYPVDIDDVQGNDETGAAGVTFSDCMLAASQWFAFAGPELYGVFGRATFTGRVGFSNCRFHLGNRLVNIEGGGRVNLTGCWFQKWTVNAVRIAAGTATLTGNTFRIGSPNPVVVITGGPWVSASGNLFEAVEHLAWDLTGMTAAARFNESGNTYADAPAWTAVTYQNGWADLGPGFQGVSYTKVDGRVYLRGTAKNGVVALGTPMFTLPTGFRPPSNLLFAVQSNGAFGYLSVASSGVVSVGAGNNTSVSFDGIDFSVR